MRLNITKIRPQDYGEYHCVSKNEMGIARAVFHLQGNDFPFCVGGVFSAFSFTMTWKRLSILLILQSGTLTSCEASPTRQRIRLSSALDLRRRNLMKTFVDRPKPVLNVPSQGEFKFKLAIVLRINYGINVFISSSSGIQLTLITGTLSAKIRLFHSTTWSVEIWKWNWPEIKATWVCRTEH